MVMLPIKTIGKNSTKAGFYLIFFLLLILGLLYGYSQYDKYQLKKAVNEPIFDLKKDGWAAVTDSVFVSRGDVSENMTLIVDGSEAAIIDTGVTPKLLENTGTGVYWIKNYIDKHNLEVKYIFYTHYDMDHFSNTGLFTKDDLESKIQNITPLNSKDGQLIRLGNKTLKVIVTPGHATHRGGHISIELIDEDLLVSGDVIYTNFISGMDNNGDKLEDLTNTLNKIKEKNYKIIIPGHGNIIEAKYAVQRQLDYLQELRKRVKAVVDKGGDFKEVHKKVKVTDCIEVMDGFGITDAIWMHENNLRNVYYELTGKRIPYRQ